MPDMNEPVEIERSGVRFTCVGETIEIHACDDGRKIDTVRSGSDLAAYAEQWIARRVADTLPKPLRCINCGEGIGRIDGGGGNPDGALELVPHGWYGGYIDTLQPPHGVLLCGSCADVLCLALPGLARAMRAMR